MVCYYGCGREAKYKSKSGRWCCEKFWQSCPEGKKRMSELKKNISEETRRKMSESGKWI